MSHPPRPVTLPRIVSLAPAEPAGDEPPPRDTPYVQGTLALAYDPESREPGPDDPDGSHARPLIWGPPGAVPDARRLRALGQAFAEILSGRRPPSTVSRQTTSQVQAELLRAGKVFDCPVPDGRQAPSLPAPGRGGGDVRARALRRAIPRAGVTAGADGCAVVVHRLRDDALTAAGRPGENRAARRKPYSR
ncbi:Rv3235 family protein [Planobispora rosea]|uniref:Rv3235 family protein n=1 Tax=Planobispora rosea TaxID=35762 RepID=UPI003CC807DB